MKTEASNFDRIINEWKAALGAQDLGRFGAGQSNRPQSTVFRAGKPASTPEATLAQTTPPGTHSVAPEISLLSQWREYTLHDVIGEGGMGQIIRADQGGLKRE